MVKEKIQKIQGYLQKKNLDYLMVANFGHETTDAVIYYLLLKNPEHGILILSQTDKPILFITSFEVIQTQDTFPELDVRPFDQKFIDLAAKTLTKNSIIGFRTQVFPTLAYEALTKLGYTLINTEHLDAVIARKDDEEINAMRRVTAETDTAFSSLITHWSEFITELNAARFLSRYALEHDYELSFPTIIASGPNAAHPHHVTSATKLSRGFCVIDMGLRINGYCSDMTRTIFIGTPTNDERSRYELLQKIQAATADRVKPKVTTAELDAFCRRELGDLKKYFIHGLGHGVGTQVHEWPIVGEKNSVPLEAGMVVTIEPGIYEEGNYGIRIEDDILVTEHGYEVLTKTTKNLILV